MRNIFDMQRIVDKVQMTIGRQKYILILQFLYTNNFI